MPTATVAKPQCRPPHASRRDELTRADRKALNAEKLAVLRYAKPPRFKFKTAAGLVIMRDSVPCFVLYCAEVDSYLAREALPSKFRWTKMKPAAARFPSRRVAASVARALVEGAGGEMALMDELCMPGPSAESVHYPRMEDWFRHRRWTGEPGKELAT